MRRCVLLGALLIGGWLVAPGCGNGDGGNDSGHPGQDAGPDSGTPADGGRPDAGADAGVPSCQGLTPPTVPLQVSAACPGFTACGGNPAGRWVYDGGCAPNPFTNLTDVCNGVTVSSPTGTISGCVSFSGANSGTVARQVAWTLTATADFPSTCVPSGCASLQDAVRTYYPTATCSTTSGGCACTVTRTGSVNDSSGFVVTGTEIIAGGVSYPFCAPAGGALQYREGGSSPQFPEGNLARR
jgi:hypothetical protein